MKFHQKKKKNTSPNLVGEKWKGWTDTHVWRFFFFEKKINKMFFGGHAIAGLTSQEKLQTNRWLLQSWHPSSQGDFTSSL
jgi:hypothetical protein